MKQSDKAWMRDETALYKTLCLHSAINTVFQISTAINNEHAACVCLPLKHTSVPELLVSMSLQIPTIKL